MCVREKWVYITTTATLTSLLSTANMFGSSGLGGFNPAAAAASGLPGWGGLPPGFPPTSSAAGLASLAAAQQAQQAAVLAGLGPAAGTGAWLSCWVVIYVTLTLSHFSGGAFFYLAFICTSLTHWSSLILWVMFVYHCCCSVPHWCFVLVLLSVSHSLAVVLCALLSYSCSIVPDCCFVFPVMYASHCSSLLFCSCLYLTLVLLFWFCLSHSYSLVLLVLSVSHSCSSSLVFISLLFSCNCGHVFISLLFFLFCLHLILVLMFYWSCMYLTLALFQSCLSGMHLCSLSGLSLAILLLYFSPCVCHFPYLFCLYVNWTVCHCLFSLPFCFPSSHILLYLSLASLSLSPSLTS